MDSSVIVLVKTVSTIPGSQAVTRMLERTLNFVNPSVNVSLHVLLHNIIPPWNTFFLQSKKR